MFQNFINYLLLFKNIPQGDIAIIEQELSYRKVTEGEVLFNEGDIMQGNVFYM